VGGIPAPTVFNAYHDIILGFGLCSNSLINLTSKDHILIIPKVHDCIALFYGSQYTFLKAAEKEWEEDVIRIEAGEKVLLTDFLF
jgi:uncharacterized protein DUF1638